MAGRRRRRTGQRPPRKARGAPPEAPPPAVQSWRPRELPTALPAPPRGADLADRNRHRAQIRFLLAFQEHGNVSRACQQAQVHRSLVYDWRGGSPAFEEAFRACEEIAAEVLEEEARRRAIDGVPEPVYYEGRRVGYVTRYSDRLLEFLLRGRKPLKYGRVTVNAPRGPAGDGATPALPPGEVQATGEVVVIEVGPDDEVVDNDEGESHGDSSG